MIFIVICLVLSNSGISSGTGISQKDEVEFIELASYWRRGHKFPIDDCLFYNFGYQGELPLTKLNLNLEEHLAISINSHGMQTPTGCSIVLIAGQNVERVDEIMKKIEDISEQVEFVPLAVFIFGTTNIDSSFRNDYSPAMVRIS